MKKQMEKPNEQIKKKIRRKKEEKLKIKMQELSGRQATTSDRSRPPTSSFSPRQS
jgi:hypothetical protein